DHGLNLSSERKRGEVFPFARESDYFGNGGLVSPANAGIAAKTPVQEQSQAENGGPRRDCNHGFPYQSSNRHGGLGCHGLCRRFRCELRFTFETSESLRVAGNFLRQEFQCNEAMKPRVVGLVNDAHATAAELLDAAVVRDGLAD